MAAIHISTDTEMNPAVLLRLLQLASPALPTGAFAYSQGLESAVAQGWLRQPSEVEAWLRGLLRYPLRYLDCPLLKRLYDAWSRGEFKQACYWNDYLLASRETHELQQEDKHLGHALLRLLIGFEIEPAQRWAQPEHCGFATMFALAASHWQIPLAAAAQGYLWNWAENQTTAAIKLVPLGQTNGQQILSALIPDILETMTIGLALPDDEIGCATPGLALLSAQHETQYTRLFRS